MADRNVRIDITAADRTRQGIDSAKAGLRSLEGSVNNMRGVFTAFTAVTASLGIAGVLREALQATEAYERSTRKLEGVLRATGNVSGHTREQLEQMALTMERETLFAQNELRDAMSMMLTFKSVQGETFNEGIRLATDLSTVMDQSLRTSVIQIGKALEDPVRGFSALREVGITVNAQQEEMIKNFAAMGETAKAQGVIIDLLRGQFGGAAGEVNQGLSGALQSTSEAWARLMQEMGKTSSVKTAVEGGLLGLTELIDGLTSALDRANRSFLDGPIAPGGRLRQRLEDLPGQHAGTEGRADTPPPGPTMRDVRTPEMIAESNKFWENERQQQAAAAAEHKKATEERAKLEKTEAAERLKEATFLSNLYAKEQAAAQQRHEAAISQAVERQRLRIEEGEATDAMISDAIEAGAAVRAEIQGEIDARRDKVQALVDSLASEWGLLVKWHADKQEMINDAEAVGLQIEGGWQKQRLRLTQEFQRRETEIVDEAVKRRFGINQVYRQLDAQSAQFFFGQMGLMMESGSRKMFEIGKAGAIGETIIQTYRAAQGAYASLASIPIVGPALGAAAAAAAVVAGLARVQAIRSTEFGGGAVAVPTFNANPVTGVPTEFSPLSAPQEIQDTQQLQQAPRVVNVTVQSDSGMVSMGWIRDQLAPTLQEALGDGLVLNVN